MRAEELYNKAEIHSINTSKGDTADVGIFSFNAKVTIYEFLESAEIAYLGWGNSVQKANFFLQFIFNLKFFLTKFKMSSEFFSLTVVSSFC